MMRSVSAGHRRSQRSRLQVKTGKCGMFRLTEPRDAEKHMQAFLDHGAVPVLSFKASCDNRVNASLSRPLQTVRTEHMCIATSILTRVVEEWGCVEELVRSTRGEQIKKSPEDVIDEYLIHHNVPGKLQLRWVDRMTSGGKLQEVGPREEPTGRSLRLWISRGFDGARFSRSLTAFANHEICTHAVRAINDRVQVWACRREVYGLTSDARERQSTEEGLASLNSVICYPRGMRHLWSAAMLYYCAVKGQDMGFGELHRHLVKYVRSPTKRYWYCIRTKGKLAELDKPGACGKGQVYLEGAVAILRSVDTIDFHLLYSGKVPLSKLARVKNIVRRSLVTLPKFVQDQAKYKATLRQIGRLNGILPAKLPLPSTRRRAISSSVGDLKQHA
ncbi:unnamed protein product [Ascophyllum nodosum]